MSKVILTFTLTLLSQLTIGQVNFTKHPTNPILPRTTFFGEWDAIAASDPHVLNHNDTLKMWYTGVGWLSTSDTSVHQRIGYTWSLDGINWTQSPSNPVLDRTYGSWDDVGVETSTVIVDSTANMDKRFKMWYTGLDTNNLPSDINGYYYEIGYATSPGSLSLPEIDLSNNEISLYPNPCENYLKINIKKEDLTVLKL